MQMSRNVQFRKWAQEVCWRLKLTPPFTPETLVRAVAAFLDREIEVVEHDLEGSTIYGFCAALPRQFLIAVRQDAPLDQRERIIYHEVAHILLGHVAHDGHAHACRELDATDPQERDAEDAARALASYAHSNDAKKRKQRRDDSGLEMFWDEMGSEG